MSEAKVVDKNGVKLSINDSVNVDPPRGSQDLHNFDFNGTVDSFRNGNIIVVDGDDEYFELESSQVEFSED